MAWKPMKCTIQADKNMPIITHARRLGDSEPVRL